LCELSNKRNKVVLPIINGVSPLIMYIGESPGETEDRTGVPFSGRTKKWNDFIINGIGIKSYIIMNTIQCKSSDKPTQYQMDKCFVYIKHLLLKYRPKLVVLYGTYPIIDILGFEPPVKNYVGRFYEKEIDDISFNFFAMYHPSTLLYRKDKYYDIFIRHIELIKKFYNLI
jgi:DNA polymerase